MADEKKDSGGSSGIDPWNSKLIIFIIIILVLPTIFAGRGIINLIKPNPPSNTIDQLESSKQPFFSIARMIGTGDLILGERVSTLKEVSVRNYPGGSILGVQEKLKDGRLMEGPVSQFNTLWWRVNFEEAPSGWVEFDNLTVRSTILKSIYLPYIIYKGYKPIGWILTFILLIILLVLRFKLSHEQKIFNNRIKVQYEQAEREKKEKVSETRSEFGLDDGEEFKNSRWEHVQELMKSKVQSDWRQAIIEADIILDEMLRRMSYDGLTIGDMLKQVDPADFANLEKAWEAHKFRNEIAHTGSEFKISKDEAERVISLFKAVFEEFYYI